MNLEVKFTQAATACEKKDFNTARKILDDIVKTYPLESEPYRLLGQIEYEEGNDDKAIDLLIECLKNDPKNLWGLILIGNIYSKRKKNYTIARQYYDKVLEHYPNHALALNNIAAVLMETKQYEEAIELFKKVKSLDNTYPNCYYGMAMAYTELGKFKEAFDIACEGSKISVNRPENKDVRLEILKVLLHSASEFVKQTNYMNVVMGIKDELEKEGAEINISRDDSLKVYAKLRYGKHYGTNVNTIHYNGKMENVEHLMIHEMGHLRMQNAADKNGNGKVIHKTDANDAAFNRRFGSLLRKKLMGKISNENIASFIKDVQEGIGLQLMNCPLDLFVEHYIYDHYPIMRPIQLLMLFKQEQDNIKGVRSGEITSTFPPQIVKANKIMNICTSLHFKELYGIDLVNEFKPTKAEYDQANDLLDEFHAYWDDKNLKPGEEYELVQYFIDSFNMDDIITISNQSDFIKKMKEDSSRKMSVDGGDYDIYTEEEKQRQKNFEESSKKEDPARDMMMTLYILAALEEFSSMDIIKVRKIAMEIAMLGMSGIDPSKQSGYRIPSIDRDFGGYLILAYYYTSWKLAIPDGAEQLGLPYKNQYEDAQSMYAQKYGNRLTLI